MKLNTNAFALTSGLVWGIGIFLLTWWIIALGGGPGDLAFVGKIYIGYDVTPTGSVVGLAWALVDGFIGGAIFAGVYNKISGRTMAQAQ